MKLLVVAALVALLALNAQSFRVVRQVEDLEQVMDVEQVAEVEQVADVADVEQVAEVEQVADVADVEQVADVADVEQVAPVEPEEVVESVMPAMVDEAEGTLSKISKKLKSYYNHGVDTANGYLDSIRGLKLEEKAKNLYSETSTIVTTYAGIVQDQIYHSITAQQ